ncbi:hypothetical protein KM043_004297 [Ampulex compressa]|nr:hypothetical protein KM043_004297 [Ampulex compressa]
MPKENRSSSRRGKRLSLDSNDEAPVSSGRDSMRSAMGSNRYSPFLREVPRRDSRSNDGSMPLTRAHLLDSKSNGIIQSGIKYIMFPLHLLRFCIFGTSTASVSNAKDVDAESSAMEKREKRDEKNGDSTPSKTDRRDSVERDSPPPKDTAKNSPIEATSKEERAPSSKGSGKETSRDDESSDEMLTAQEDSDSSVDQWSNAKDVMIMDMSIDYEHALEKSMSYRNVEEPMDISLDEQNLERSISGTKGSRDGRSLEGAKNSTVDAYSRSSSNEQEKRFLSTVDEEISRIFQKQCTSSDDESSSSLCRCPTDRIGGNRQTQSRNREEGRYSRTKRELFDDENQTKGRASVERRKKLAREEDVDEGRKDDRRSKDRSPEKKRSTRQDTPSKRRSRCSGTPVKNKESKQKSVKYKERATQTDSAYSDEDVEMIPIDGRRTRKSQSAFYTVEEMDRDLNYIADNEDSNDGLGKFRRTRISSGSLSSSSADLGFDERGCFTPDIDVRLKEWNANLPNVPTAPRKCATRAPPGFPQLPQNPPITSSICDGTDPVPILTPGKDQHDCTVIQSAFVQPAPMPMRHLYYNYPEFMDFPPSIGSSRILKNILKNNYNR